MSSDAERVVLSQIAVPSFGKSDEDVLMTAEASGDLKGLLILEFCILTLVPFSPYYI